MDMRGVILLLIGTFLRLGEIVNGSEVVNSAFIHVAGGDIAYLGGGKITNQTISPELCNFTLNSTSQKYFDNRVQQMQPKFVRFHLEIRRNMSTRLNITYNDTLFKPRLWFWTYDTPTGHYPYLTLNIDHGILSFGLLDAKTYDVDFILLEPLLTANQTCSIHFGQNESMIHLTNALRSLVANAADYEEYKYETNYFCYLVENREMKQSWTYFAALYFNFPAPLINFECCVVSFTYSNNKIVVHGCNKQFAKWDLCVYGPYILGVLILLYFPILLFEICDALAKGDIVESFDYDMIAELDVPLSPEPSWESDWMFLDGKPPVTFFGVIMLLVPFVIYIKILMYSDGIGKDKLKITVSDFAERGTGLGFLAILGNTTENRIKSFVPAFGGPVGMALIYYILGVVLLVFPRNLIQIVENGMPTRRGWSPLFLGVDEILHIGMVNHETVPGFGDTYLELLSTGVERSLDLDTHVNHVSYQDGHLVISNVRAPNIRSIRINNTLIEVIKNSLEKIKSSYEVARHTRQVNSVHGIPKELFEHLVRKHRPVHIQLLKLIFQLTFIIILVALTLIITSKFKSGSSYEQGPEVMHVLFMVTVGALPRVLEVLLTDGSEVVKKQLEESRIEQTIVRYWRNKTETDLKFT
ncbi:hypothetical protein MAR_026344 [Mya arenaria]|uniref:Uncharacterized protein n=1 Tax=Mya arenaria TaxID=6604 RepID=A0ABY7EST2_MYAAR|nr:hypothetical protein MAR_026344 [Mya arenaria]